MNLIFHTPNIIPQQSWVDKLKEAIFEKNQEYLRQIPTKRQYTRDNHLWKIFSNQKPLHQHHCYTLEKDNHGPYSEYTSISSNQYIPNEIVECLPYLQHLSHHNLNQYENELYAISQKISTSKCTQQWRQVCKQYAPRLELPKLISAFLRLLSIGTSIVEQLLPQLQCNRSALLFELLQMYLYFKPIPKPFALSIECRQKISLQSVSRTPKFLFCSICMIYDCPRHLVSSLAESHSYQYVKAEDPLLRISRMKQGAVNIYNQLYLIYHKANDRDNLSKACSKQCYRFFDQTSWQSLCKVKRNSSYSPIAVLQIRIGIEMYGLDPCQICTLFEATSALTKCQHIFYYLVHYYSISKRLHYKFHPNQCLHLLHQHSTFEPTLAQPSRSHRRNYKKGKNKNNFVEASNAVCFHYFLEGETEDVNCMDCHCRLRGYCLPQCQCSQFCQIPLKGCRCKGLGRCLQRCPCFKARRACVPGVCENCFKDKKGDFRCHHNEAAYSKSNSTIKGAGLGLFAGQFITKDSFILKYVGEIVESECLQKMRENLSKNSIFYTFQLNSSEVLDSRRFGNKARFMNHSQQEENVRPEVVKIREEDALVFRALRDIREGEELLFNYNGAGQLNDFKHKYAFIK